jgi:hypothetical protein
MRQQLNNVPRTIGQLPHIKSTWLGVQPTITRPTDPINIMYYVVRMLSDGSLKCINATHDKEYANDLAIFILKTTHMLMSTSLPLRM